MDKGLRNTFIGAILTILVAFIAAWVQINSRIAVLEVQVQRDREVSEKRQSENAEGIKEMKGMLYDIKAGVQHLNDVKEDKRK